MKYWITLFFVSMLFTQLHAQRKIAEMSLEYDLTLLKADQQVYTAHPMNGSVYNVLLKGPYSRTELKNTLLSTVTLFDNKQRSCVILKELSGQKLLIRLNAAQWQEKNAKYEGGEFKLQDSLKTVLGYQAHLATAQLKDGSSIAVWYTAEIDAENKSYEPLFAGLNGLPLEWSIQQGSVSLHYTIRKLNMNPIPASRFDIPKSGYRELSYEESKKGML